MTPSFNPCAEWKTANVSTMTPAQILDALAAWRTYLSRVAAAYRKGHPASEAKLLTSRAADVLIAAAELHGLNGARIRGAHAVYVRHGQDVARKIQAQREEVGGEVWLHGDEFLRMCAFARHDLNDAERCAFGEGVEELQRLKTRLTLASRELHDLDAAALEAERVQSEPKPAQAGGGKPSGIGGLLEPVKLTAVTGIVGKRSDVIAGKLERAGCTVVKVGRANHAEDADVQKVYPKYRKFRVDNPAP